MKKILSVVLSIMFLVCCCNTAFAYEYSEETKSIDYSKYAGKTLTVYNWGEYISDGEEDSMDVNKEFEALTGIKVEYVEFETNEDMYAKLKAGGASYDVVIPSDYMIARMIKEGMLEKLNFDNIPNFKNISDEYKNLYYDANNEYTVPYCVGKVGLIYNKTMVEGSPDSWSILWDKQYEGKILMINNSRDAFGVAQFLLGQSVNTTNEEEWKAAAEKLKEQSPLLKGYVMDEVFNNMESGSAAMVPYYAGDFLTMYANNNDLAFVYPKEGTNIFVDCACIPKGAAERGTKEMAELYINFLADPAVAVENAIYTGYASPNKAVLEDTEYTEYLAEIHPNAEEYLYGEVAKVEYFHDLPDETKTLMNSLWEDLKVSGSNNVVIIVVCCVLIAAIVIFFIVRGKKRKSASYD